MRTGMTNDPITTANTLTDLAARIRAEPLAVGNALKDSLRHAFACGELLLEAKKQVPHGRWLTWLRDHCYVTPRSAQFYMRVARNWLEIEAQMRNGISHLG